MTVAEAARQAVESLLAHRVRTVLCTIGVAAGVGTVVTALAIANGARARALQDIGALGVDTVIVRAHTPAAGRRQPLAPALSIEDANTVQARWPMATVAARRSAADTVASADRAVSTTISGVTPGWKRTANISIVRGRWFTTADADARVTVIGTTIATALFGSSPPIGQQVLAAGEWRTVVGVVPDDLAGAGAPALFVPLASLDVSLGAGDAGDAINELVVRFPAGSNLHAEAARVLDLLTARHDGDRAFDVIVPAELLEARLRAERTFHLLLLALGALALLISGTGITNIMAASVLERASEICLRRAVGARRRAIVLQFVAEALTIVSCGAIAGVLAGVLASGTIGALAAWPMQLSAGAMLLAIALALAVGLAAAVYPARLAARLVPIDALRE